MHVNSIWIIDSGFSNHMTSAKDLFKTFNESWMLSVRLGNYKEILVLDQGIVTIRAEDG